MIRTLPLKAWFETGWLVEINFVESHKMDETSPAGVVFLGSSSLLHEEKTIKSEQARQNPALKNVEVTI
jgi:hypothetical protein